MDRSLDIAERIAARYPLLYVIGSEEADMRTLVEGAGQAVGVPVVAPRYGRQPAGDAACDAVQSLLESNHRTVLLLPLGHRLLGDAALVQLLCERVREVEKAGHTIILLAAYEVPCPELRCDRVVLEVALPDVDELRPIVRSAFTSSSGALPDDTLLQQALAASKGMVPAQLRRALRRVRLGHEAMGTEAVAALRAEKRDLVAGSGVLDVIDTAAALADVGGLHSLKQWLHRRRGALGDKARAYGLPAPRGVLLIGVQGCGKSLFAKASAAALDLPLLRFDLGRLFRRDSAPDENLRRALQITEAMAPVVLWVDEIDKAFAGAMSGSDATARIFGTFIVWLAEHREGVFVAATANRIDHLPAELMRKGRFDETFFVDLPGSEVRAEILAIHIRHSGRDPADFDLERLGSASDQRTGAEIEQAIIEALAVAFEADREPTTEDIEKALAATVPFVQTCEEQVKALREWAHRRARNAGQDRSVRDLFLEAHRTG